MKTLLQQKATRKTFLITISIILFVILIIRIFILPNFEIRPTVQAPYPKDPRWLTIVTGLLDSAFVSLTVTVSIALFLFYIELPDEEKKFEIVEPFKINDLFQQERNNTEIWFFSGGTGRFTRSKTIPELARIAKNNNRHINLKMQIINPSNKMACENYAIYRRSLRSSGQSENTWTEEYVKQEICATIVCAIIHKSTYPLLDIAIALKNNFSTLRIDLSSKVAIITKEDKQEPALICREGSFLYRTYKEEILQTFKQYRQLNLLKDYAYGFDTLTEKAIKDMLSEHSLHENLSENDYKKILAIIKENKNPYAK